MMMNHSRRGISMLIPAIPLIIFSCGQPGTPEGIPAGPGLERAAVQYAALAEKCADTAFLPRTADSVGNMIYAPSSWWTSGFVPGTLWQLYEAEGNSEWMDRAREYTSKVEKEKYNTTTHDLGFMLYCSFGRGYRLTGDTAYRNILLTGARSLASRFDPAVGCIKSWNSNAKWQFPVIIDNMMNLEYLLWAFRETGDSTYYNICISHADTTLKNHFRQDHSSFHVVSYDTLTGRPDAWNTAQGAHDSSAWARGQSWGLYGYTMMYRETGLERYLEKAQQIADFLISHPSMPADGIPYWDYDAPGIPGTRRDASAAAIMASALVELSTLGNGEKASTCHAFAEKQLRKLTTDEYLAGPGTNGNFILKHGVGHFPANSEVDVPLTYADYYYVEALLRMKELARRKQER